MELNDENLRETIEQDILGRNANLLMLGRMLLNQQDNIMISLDGSWGSGKTFFIKQFEYLIKNIDKFPDNRIFVEDEKAVFETLRDNNLVVYYNAWQNDDHDDPLKSIIFSVLNEFPNQKKQLLTFKEYKKVVKAIAEIVLNVIGLKDFKLDAIEEMKTFEDITDSIVTIEEKKDAFNKLVDDLLVEKQRLILIVDELDRCRPTFAVRMLETLKHFYANKKITVIVATNNHELSHTIRKFYGSEFDGYGYLNKFYDVVVTLEIKNIKLYLQKQLDFCNRTYLPQDMSYVILKHYNFSLRECNKFISIYNLLNSYIEHKPYFNENDNYVFSCVLLPLAIALKIKYIDSYNLFMSGKGQDIIRNFVQGIENETKMIQWIKELLGNPQRDYVELLVDRYNDIFKVTDPLIRIDFFEAISLLGTNIEVDD